VSGLIILEYPGIIWLDEVSGDVPETSPFIDQA